MRLNIISFNEETLHSSCNLSIDTNSPFRYFSSIPNLSSGNNSLFIKMFSVSSSRKQEPSVHRIIPEFLLSRILASIVFIL